MRASQLPILTSVLIIAGVFATLSGMAPWPPFEQAREAFLSWGQAPQQSIPKIAAALWTILAGFFGAWLGSSLSLSVSCWIRVALLGLFGLLLISLAGTLSLLGWAGEPFTATACAMVCFAIAWILSRKRHQQLRQLQQLGLLARVSSARVHGWLDRKKPLEFPESTTIASLVSLTVEKVPADNQQALLSQALAFLLNKGGCLEAIGQQHLQVWFGFPREKARSGRQASRALLSWHQSQAGKNLPWQASVVTGSIEMVKQGDGQGTHLKAVGPWPDIGRIATTSHSEPIVVDATTHEMLDDDSWTCHSIKTAEDDSAPDWYEISCANTPTQESEQAPFEP